MSINIPTTTEVAAALERGARGLAPAVAAVIVLVMSIYSLGFALGQWLHQLNDDLAAAWRSAWVPAPFQVPHTPDALRRNGFTPAPLGMPHTPAAHPTRHLEPLRCKGSAGFKGLQPPPLPPSPCCTPWRA